MHCWPHCAQPLEFETHEVLIAEQFVPDGKPKSGVSGHKHVTPRLRFPVASPASPLGFLASAFAHGAIALAAVGAGASAAVDVMSDEPPSRVTLVVPEMRSPPPSVARDAAEAVREGLGDRTTPTDESDASSGANVLGVDARVSRVFQVIEVDSSAQRDPSSSAPIYPEHYQRRGIEGWVDVRFVVDTLGGVEPNSVVIVSSTSAVFTQAVLDALPTMRFRPAQLAGRAVRQVSEQRFRFRVVRAEGSRATQVFNP